MTWQLIRFASAERCVLYLHHISFENMEQSSHSRLFVPKYSSPQNVSFEFLSPSIHVMVQNLYHLKPFFPKIIRFDFCLSLDGGRHGTAWNELWTVPLKNLQIELSSPTSQSDLSLCSVTSVLIRETHPYKCLHISFPLPRSKPYDCEIYCVYSGMYELIVNFSCEDYRWQFFLVLTCLPSNFVLRKLAHHENITTFKQLDPAYYPHKPDDFSRIGSVFDFQYPPICFRLLVNAIYQIHSREDIESTLSQNLASRPILRLWPAEALFMSCFASYPESGCGHANLSVPQMSQQSI
ncbi:hypothetical protein LENED_004944 [Lentinula edodes]|uniref:Uncharacterized protein n=1 Tax=Lentinula edodes TaxID=5353 RepID=A0A1Q3E7M5_LENED|nr:hypothetical protein LENED_004944 [Lentinula edodes]